MRRTTVHFFILSLLVVLGLFSGGAFAATTLNSCANLTAAGEVYSLGSSFAFSDNGNLACFNVTAANVVLDC